MSTSPVPQANSVELIAAAVDLVSVGTANSTRVAIALGLAPRQGAYYLNAAASLNLVRHDGDQPRNWSLTAKGARFAAGSSQKRADIIKRSLRSQALVKTYRTQGLNGLIRQLTGLSGVTAARRISTIAAWDEVSRTPAKVLALSL